jgi:hypothetical protein
MLAILKILNGSDHRPATDMPSNIFEHEKPR